MTEYEIEYWENSTNLETVEYFQYWNNEEKEKVKEWYIRNNNFAKVEKYLNEVKLKKQLYQCLSFVENRLHKSLHGVGADLAAGNLWAVTLLLNTCRIEKIYCVEYSKHRLLKLGPKILEYYHVPQDKVVLCLGSFYKLKLPDAFLDFVFLSQAFHHADKPDKLLTEIRRVIKPKGVVLIIGEHIFPAISIKHFLKYCITKFVPPNIQRVLCGRTFNTKIMFPKYEVSDSILGDHRYSTDIYQTLFSQHGFKSYRIRTFGSPLQAFVLEKLGGKI